MKRAGRSGPPSFAPSGTGRSGVLDGGLPNPAVRSRADRPAGMAARRVPGARCRPGRGRRRSGPGRVRPVGPTEAGRSGRRSQLAAPRFRFTPGREEWWRGRSSVLGPPPVVPSSPIRPSPAIGGCTRGGSSRMATTRTRRVRTRRRTRDTCRAGDEPRGSWTGGGEVRVIMEVIGMRLKVPGRGGGECKRLTW